VAPNASQLRAAAVGRQLIDLLRQDAVLENEIVSLYDEATRFCERVRDGENAAFFRQLLEEETAHAEEIRDWLSSLGVPRSRAAEERVYF
jgi:bacterioferritin